MNIAAPKAVVIAADTATLLRLVGFKQSSCPKFGLHLSD